MAKGHKLWFFPDGYIPPNSVPGEYVSHESVCVLNCENADATVKLTIYFEDRDPLENIIEIVPAKRTRHIRTALMEGQGGEKIPVGVPYAIEVSSNVPVIVQYSRLDATQAANTLMGSMGYFMD